MKGLLQQRAQGLETSGTSELIEVPKSIITINWDPIHNAVNEVLMVALRGEHLRLHRPGEWWIHHQEGSDRSGMPDLVGPIGSETVVRIADVAVVVDRDYR